jgi:ATP-binding cassette, subfamily C, bacterial
MPSAPLGVIVEFLSRFTHVMRWRVGLACALIALAGVTEGLGLLLLFPLLGALGVQGGDSTPGRLVTSVLSWLHRDGRGPDLPILLGLIAAATALQAGISWWQVRVAYALEHEFVARERDRLYRAIAAASWTFVSTRRGSDFTHVLNTELQRVGIAAYQLLSLAMAATMTLVYVLIAVRLSPVMSLLALGAGLIPLALTWLPLRASQKSGERVAEANAAVHRAAIEHLAAAKTARSYGAGDRSARLFASLAHEVADANAAVIAAHTNQRAFVQIASAVVLAGLLYVAARVLALPSAEILVFVFIFARLTPRLSALHSGLQSLLVLLPAWTTFSNLLRDCIAAAEHPDGADAPVSFRSLIVVDRVTYRYPHADHPAVSDVTLQIPAGRIVGLAGPSGCGKTTVADLLLGLLRPEQGAILIDGAPLTAEGSSSWRDQIGYVAQDTFLFHDTVRANLLWAHPAATEDDIVHALRLAAADRFVSQLPQGLETVLGDRGIRLSGGERQRLALARALLRRPKLLILDEATSALDSENERAIQQSIEGLRGILTVLVITHRLTTIRDADVICVMDEGRVVESGRWRELLERDGRFARLAHAQGVDGLLTR